MANEQNLKPLNKRPQRERKEIARMGAKASNEVQASKKLLKQSAQLLLSLPVDKELKSDLKAYNLSNQNCNYAMAIVVAQIKTALQGNTTAFNAIRDIIGENPKNTNIEDFSEDDKNIVINIIPASNEDIEKDVSVNSSTHKSKRQFKHA